MLRPTSAPHSRHVIQDLSARASFWCRNSDTSFHNTACPSGAEPFCRSSDRRNCRPDPHQSRPSCPDRRHGQTLRPIHLRRLPASPHTSPVNIWISCRAAGAPFSFATSHGCLMNVCSVYPLPHRSPMPLMVSCTQFAQNCQSHAGDGITVGRVAIVIACSSALERDNERESWERCAHPLAALRGRGTDYCPRANLKRVMSSILRSSQSDHSSM